METISVEEVARLLGVNPQSIRSQAAKDVRQLGFPASRIGTRTIIPKEGFFKWAKGEANDLSDYRSNHFRYVRCVRHKVSVCMVHGEAEDGAHGIRCTYRGDEAHGREQHP
jgi:hypothetical protein